MEIFIHIGPHKTGTTTIQSGLWRNKAALHEAGVYLPQTGSDVKGAVAHHNLAWAVNKRKGKTKGRENLLDNLATELHSALHFQKAILSSEEFCILAPSEIFRIKQCLRGYEVRVVVYLRRQDKLLQSIWSQLIKNPKNLYHKSFGQFIKKFSSEIHPINYQRMINNWAGVFGKENMILNVMEKGSLKGHLFHDFLSLCGLKNPAHYEIPKDLNQSPDLKTVSLFYHFKRNWKGGRDPKMMAFLFSCVNELARLQEWDKTAMNLIGKGRYQQIMHLYADSNSEIARTYFGREQLFLEPFQTRPMIRMGRDNLSFDEWRYLITRTPMRYLLRKNEIQELISLQNNERYARLMRIVSNTENPLRNWQKHLTIFLFKVTNIFQKNKIKYNSDSMRRLG